MLALICLHTGDVFSEEMTRPPPFPRPAPDTATPSPQTAGRPLEAENGPEAPQTVQAEPPEYAGLAGPPAGQESEQEPDLWAFPGLQGTWAGRWRALSRLPLSLMITSTLLGLGIVQLSFQLGNIVYRSYTWQQETAATRARVNILQRDVNILRDAEKAAQTPQYLEELARCQGFVRRSETVVVAAQAPTTPGENCQTLRLP